MKKGRSDTEGLSPDEPLGRLDNTRGLALHWKVAMVGVPARPRRFEYMNEDFFRISTCYPGPTWPSLVCCPLTLAPRVQLHMALHLRPTDPLPPPASPIPDPAGVCISLNTKRCADNWRRPCEFEQSELCLLGGVNGSSGALSLLVESLPTPSPTGRNPQFADLAYRRSSNRTYYMFSVPAFARSCCAFPRLI